MTLEDLWSLATVRRPDGYTSWPDPYTMAPTLEDCELLHSLVRVTKPQRVLELGTGMGVSARFISDALLDNGSGYLVTIEPNHDFWPSIEETLNPKPGNVGVADKAPSTSSGKYDLVFIDSGWEHRKQDIRHWLSVKGPLLVVHDANRDYAGLQGHGVFLPGSDGLWIGRAR